MDNFLAILAVGGFGAVAGMLAAVFSSETFRTEGPLGFLRWMHWKLSTTERQRHPYLY